MNSGGLFSTSSDNQFFGRAEIIERLFALPSEKSRLSSAVYLCGKRWAGKTEILRRVHKKLFFEQTAVTPVYYQFKDYPDTAGFAEDFLKEILKQTLAFRRRSPGLAVSPMTLDAIDRLLGAHRSTDGLREFIQRHREAQKTGDQTAAFRNALRAPLSINSNTNMPVFLILDDLDLAHRAVCFEGRPGIKRDLSDALNALPFFIAAGREKGVLDNGIINTAELLPLDGLDEEVSFVLLAELCARNGVEAGAEALTAASRKLEGCPFYMKNFVYSAKKAVSGLLSLNDFARVYADDITDGNTAQALRSYIKLDGLNSFKVLKECADDSAGNKATGAEELAGTLFLSAPEVKQSIKELCALGLVESSLGAVIYTGGGVTADFISYAYGVYAKGLSPGEARAGLINGLLRSGFDTRYSRVRSKLKEEVEGVLRGFDGQKVDKTLLRFSTPLTGLEESAGLGAPPSSKDDKIALPQITGFYGAKSLEESAAGPELIVAEGFDEGRYEDAGSVVWLAAIKDSEAPVTGEDAENFLRRIGILKENFKDKKTVCWVIGREGFTAVARKILDGAGAFTTDGARLNGLKQSLMKDGGEGGLNAGLGGAVSEFEVVIPSSSMAELVAANAADGIAVNMGFDENARGAIKTAVVEACINAFEHGRFKTGRVLARFIAGKDRLVIHVRNGGTDFSAPVLLRQGASAGLLKRRGWGLELMKGLMDEVRFEKLSGGAGIVMTKLLGRKGDASDAKQA